MMLTFTLIELCRHPEVKQKSGNISSITFILSDHLTVCSFETVCGHAYLMKALKWMHIIASILGSVKVVVLVTFSYKTDNYFQLFKVTASLINC